MSDDEKPRRTSWSIDRLGFRRHRWEVLLEHRHGADGMSGFATSRRKAMDDLVNAAIDLHQTFSR